MQAIKNTDTINDFAIKVIENNNIPFPDFLVTNHPRIVNNMMLFWGCKDFSDYTQKLVVNEQSRGNRQGFLPGAFLEIMNLINLHDQKFPQFANQPSSDLYGNHSY